MRTGTGTVATAILLIRSGCGTEDDNLHIIYQHTTLFVKVFGGAALATRPGASSPLARSACSCSGGKNTHVGRFILIEAPH